MTACISDLSLDEILAGEMPRAPHLESCASCRARERDRIAERDRFRRMALPLRRRSRTWLAPVAAMAAAAAIAVVMVSTRDDGGTRTKGHAHGSVVIVGRAGATPLDDRARPGDTLAYLVTTAEPSYVAVLGRDATGKATTYFPLGDRAELVDAGRDIELPIATRLDASLGREQIVIAVCSHPVPVAELAAATDPPEGCSFDRTSFTKVP